MDDSLFEDKKFDGNTAENAEFDDSLFEDVPAPAESAPLPEVSQPEAFGIGAIQGSTLGTAPIAAGIGGGLMDMVEGFGDKLGLTTDSQLTEGIDVEDLPGLTPELKAKLAGQKTAVTLPDEKTGLEGLMAEYYDSRDRMKGLQNASAEQHPLTTIAGNIVGSIPTTIAAGGATGALSKILPQADNFTKATTLGTKIAAGAREGAKAGALVGFGSGDAKLADGEIYDTFRETADSTVGGALVGGAFPVAGKVLSKGAELITDLPIVNQLKTAFKGGQAKIKLNEASAGDAIKSYSEDLLREIRSQFTKAGLTKANALDYADEVGVRIKAGEAFQDVMDDIVTRGAMPGEDLAEKMALYKRLKTLKDGAPDVAQNKLDLNQAKTQQKMEAKGFELLDTDTVNGNVADYVPGTSNNQPVTLKTQNFQKIAQDAAEGIDGEKVVESPVVQKLIQQAGEELPININQYDLDNLSVRELGDIMSEINRHTGDLKAGTSNTTEIKARALAAQLKNLRDEALETAGINGGNKSLSRTFSALDRAGIDDNVLTNNPIRKDAMVDKLRDTVTANNSIDRERMFQYLEEASPEGYGGFREGADFLNEFRNIAKTVKPLNSGSSDPVSLAGGARNIALSVSNKAGGGYQALKNLTSLPVEKLGQIAQRFGMSQNQASQQYSSVLMKAAKADERQRSAILYGLYQQPAFKELYQNLGEDLNDTVLPVGTNRESEN